jgi:hypothetical protein
MGAYDEGHWETRVIDFGTGTGSLKRGTVICLDVGGKGAIAAAGNENQAEFRSIRRSTLPRLHLSAVWQEQEVFKGNQLLVSVGTDGTKLTSALRQAGIFLEGDLVVPTS